MDKKRILISAVLAAVIFTGCEHPAKNNMPKPETDATVSQTMPSVETTPAPEADTTTASVTVTTTTAPTTVTTVTTTVPTTVTTVTTTLPTTVTTVTTTTAATTVPTTVTKETEKTNVPPVRQKITGRWNGISLTPIYENGMEFVWNQLSDDVKDNVAVMMNAMRNLKPKFALKHPIKEDEIWQFVHFVHDYLCGYTHVDYYDYTYWYDENNYVTDLEFVYTADAKEAKEMNEAVQNKVDEIVASAPDTSERDRIKYFHDYIVKNCTYSYNGKSVDTAYGALIDGKAICQGYAHALQMLLSRAGFDAVPAMGDSDDGYHKWNYVKLSDGKWYVIDATWDDPTGDEPDYVGYDYFMITDEQVEKDHSHRYGSRYFTVPTAE